MKIGYIGLGKMGKNMVLHLLEQGIEVVAWNRSPEPLAEVVAAGAMGADSLEDLVSKLRNNNVISNVSEQSSFLQSEKSADSSQARNDKIVIWIMLPAGEVTDEFIDKVLPLLSPNDILIDGGNSFYKDTLRRAEKIKHTGVHFMDIGTSGGPGGARTGACLMIGGEDIDVENLKELFSAASAKDAWGYFGPIGSGHFAKMVHNGIEYGMMEAISEGLAILKTSQFDLNLSEVLRVYNNRSVVESRLVGWMKEAIDEDQELAEYSAKIGHTGEGEWTIKTAEELGIDARVIRDSFEIRVESDNVDDASPDGYRNRATSAMRGKFGQHAVKK